MKSLNYPINTNKKGNTALICLLLFCLFGKKRSIKLQHTEIFVIPKLCSISLCTLSLTNTNILTQRHLVNQILTLCTATLFVAT